MLARQILPLEPLSQTFFVLTLVIFSRVTLYALASDPLTFASPIAGMTGLCHHTVFVH
jgi:hypothetical protein